MVAEKEAEINVKFKKLPVLKTGSFFYTKNVNKSGFSLSI